ncbi:MAG: aldehyde-activating protein [Rhodospirillaceae bacterium]|nr:MAG: aldehyde-activating protein [Rhodospirillaceae bacterium]
MMKSQSSIPHKHAGGCHCGNIRVVIELPNAPSETALRACGCSFCRTHGVRVVSDSSGAFKMWAQDWSSVTRYRFGTGTADFMLCTRCGTYVAAVAQTSSGLKAVANVNSLNDRALFTAEPAIMNFDGETVEQRLARHAATWMPAILHE